MDLDDCEGNPKYCKILDSDWFSAKSRTWMNPVKSVKSNRTDVLFIMFFYFSISFSAVTKDIMQTRYVCTIFSFKIITVWSSYIQTSTSQVYFWSYFETAIFFCVCVCVNQNCKILIFFEPGAQVVQAHCVNIVIWSVWFKLIERRKQWNITTNIKRKQRRRFYCISFSYYFLAAGYVHYILVQDIQTLMFTLFRNII